MKTITEGWNGDGVQRGLHNLKVDGSDTGGLWRVFECDEEEQHLIELGFIQGKHVGECGQVYEAWSEAGRSRFQYGYARTWEGALQIMLTMERCDCCGSLVLPNDSCPRGCERDDSALQSERLTEDLASMKASNVRLLQLLEKVQTQIGAALQDEMLK